MNSKFLKRILVSNFFHRVLNFFSIFGWKIKFNKNKFKLYHKKIKVYDSRIVILNKRSTAFFLYLKKIINKSPPGCVVECGLGKLKSFQMISFILLDESQKRKLYGFDSFQGFPDISEEDLSPRNPKKGDWSFVDYESTRSFLRNSEINNFVLIKGFLEDTLPVWKKKLPPIAVLHIDVDLYSS